MHCCSASGGEKVAKLIMEAIAVNGSSQMRTAALNADANEHTIIASEPFRGDNQRA